MRVDIEACGCGESIALRESLRVLSGSVRLALRRLDLAVAGCSGAAAARQAADRWEDVEALLERALRDSEERLGETWNASRREWEPLGEDDTLGDPAVTCPACGSGPQIRARERK